MIESRVLWVIRLRMLSGSSSGVSEMVGRFVELMPANGKMLLNVPNGPTGGFRLTPSVLKNGRASTEPVNSYCAAMAATSNCTGLSLYRSRTMLRSNCSSSTCCTARLYFPCENSIALGPNQQPPAAIESAMMATRQARIAHRAYRDRLPQLGAHELARSSASFPTSLPAPDARRLPPRPVNRSPSDKLRNVSQCVPSANWRQYR